MKSLNDLTYVLPKIINKMKKLLVSASLLIGMMASAMVFSSFTTSNENESTLCAATSDGPACKVVGNCTVNLVNKGNGIYEVRATNRNNYNVTVNWIAIGYDSNGKMRQVGSGSLTCGHGLNDRDAVSNSFSTNCEDVSLGDVKVLKCD